MANRMVKVERPRLKEPSTKVRRKIICAASALFLWKKTAHPLFLTVFFCKKSSPGFKGFVLKTSKGDL